METLNFDILNIIYSYLNNIKDIYNLSIVNKYLYNIFTENKKYMSCNLELLSNKYIEKVCNTFNKCRLKIIYDNND
jgi:hypothetical protein